MRRMQRERSEAARGADPGEGCRPAEAATATTAGAFAPTFAILPFLIERGPLAPWEREVLRLVLAEAEYFLPQRMTKIINEGWASFWHSRLLTGGLLDTNEIVEFADCHAGAVAAVPGQLNPYKLGIELFRYAEERGEDLFQLRKIHNDVSFVDALVDETFAERNQLFTWSRSPRTGRAEIDGRDWKQVKQQLLQGLAWCGQPQIELVDDDHEGRGELCLVHRHDGRDLKIDEASDMLRTIQGLWRRPVRLYTQQEGDGA